MIIEVSQAQQPPVWPKRQEQTEHHLEPSRLSLGKINPQWTLDEDELTKPCALTFRLLPPASSARPKSWSRESSSLTLVQDRGPQLNSAA
jgi:hypothetical protein